LTRPAALAGDRPDSLGIVDTVYTSQRPGGAGAPRGQPRRSEARRPVAQSQESAGSHGASDPPARRDTYHHGHLREALIEAGMRLAREGGPDAVGLREANRAAGVSHSAAYRHFPDRDSLLRAVSERCFAQLANLMEKRIAELPHRRDPKRHAWEALEATGRAYVEFALNEPGWFRTVFGVPPTLGPIGASEGRAETGRSAYEILSGCLDDLVATGELAASRRPGAEIGPWSAVHGLASLCVDGPLRAAPKEAKSAALDTVVDLVQRGLGRLGQPSGK
jgi:AcrR family transcriptional regulator